MRGFCIKRDHNGRITDYMIFDRGADSEVLDDMRDLLKARVVKECECAVFDFRFNPITCCTAAHAIYRDDLGQWWSVLVDRSDPECPPYEALSDGEALAYIEGWCRA